MNISMNGSPKEINQFLLFLAGALALGQGKPAPVVVETIGADRTAPVDSPEPVAEAAPVTEPAAYDPEAGGLDAGTAMPTESLSPQELEDKLSPRAGDEPAKPAEAKTRKRREKVSGESKLGTGSPSAAGAPTSGTVEPEAATGKSATPQTVDDVTLPAEWEVMSVQARRNWIQTADGLTPSQRFVLLQRNPVSSAESVKTEPEAENPSTVTETKPATKPDTPAAETAECVLPPTWGAWSLAKRIMWATMRSAPETNSLLTQFGFAGQIGEANAENLGQIRRKLEIAMRMEAQA